MTCIDPGLVLERGEGLNGDNYGISTTLGEALGVGGSPQALLALPLSEGTRPPGPSGMLAHGRERSHAAPMPGRLSARTADGGQAGPPNPAQTVRVSRPLRGQGAPRPVLGPVLGAGGFAGQGEPGAQSGAAAAAVCLSRLCCHELQSGGRGCGVQLPRPPAGTWHWGWPSWGRGHSQGSEASASAARPGRPPGPFCPHTERRGP